MQVVNTNIMSVNSQRHLNTIQSQMATSLERLSSGLRINSAKDDAAGLGIASRMTAQVNGFTQAMRNANDAVSLVQTAEGAMDEISENLQHIRRLAIQSANSTNSADDRASLQAEVTQRLAEIERIANQTQFNGTNLLDGNFSGAAFQVGANANQTIDVASIQDVTQSGLSIDAVTVATSADAQTAIGTIDTALNTLNTARGDLGAVQNRLESTVTNLANARENIMAARSRILDADFAAETANLTRVQILQQASLAMLSQANIQPQNALSLLQ